jgi:ethanolamine utilization protein EutN/carbon dioxide concentrating mechanism protein CcmL
MLLGKVVGTLVSTRKDEKLEGLKFLVLQRLDINGQLADGYVVAADAVGAGLEEVVMYATGSSARQTVMTDRRPCDAVIMAIVDTWEVNGDVKYQKVEPIPDLRGFD